MKKKRERFEIIHDILKTIESKNKIGPTRLLQLSNLSPKMFKDYIDELLDNGLIFEELQNNERKKFCLTEKGYTFMEKYKIFSNFVNELGL